MSATRVRATAGSATTDSPLAGSSPLPATTIQQERLTP
jgi:hypothetical protein